MDPHGAVAYLGLKQYQKNYSDSDIGIFVKTAHPAKFLDIVEKEIDKKIVIPDKLQQYLNRKKQTVILDNNFNDLKQFLLK